MNSLKHAALWLALVCSFRGKTRLTRGNTRRLGVRLPKMVLSRVLVLAVLLAGCAATAEAQQQFFYLQFLTPVANAAALPACTDGSIEENRSRMAMSPAPGSLYHCPDGGGTWECLAGADCPAGGGSGDVTAVGNCPDGACFQAVGQRFAFLGPTGASGIAAFRAIVEADISDLAHTTDTTCLDAGVACLFAGSASEGGAATTAVALAANGANCPAGQWAAGVDASGAAEGCTADAGGGTPSEIADADADTGCEVERTADSDILVCRTGGVDRLTVGTNGQTSIQATTFPQLIVAGGAPGSGSSDSGQVRVGKGPSGQYLSITYTNEIVTAKVAPENNSASLVLGSGNVSTLTLRNDGNAVFLQGVRLTPVATPPWACSVAGDNGREYVDDSGARCTCWGGAWIMTNDLSGSGSCA